MTSLGVSDRRLTPAERKVVNRYNTDSKFTHDSLLSKIKKTLQTAVEVELATIPIYLHTYYSIERKPKGFKSAMNPPGAWGSTAAFIPTRGGSVIDEDKTTQLQTHANKAGATIMSVVVEEMLHLSLVTNVLHALGGQPKLYGQSPTRFPARLPGHRRRGPDNKPLAIALDKYSYEHLWDFLEIEYPESLDARPEASQWETIGQLYSAARCIIACDKLTDEDFQVGAGATQFQPGFYAPNNIDTLYAAKPFNQRALPKQKDSAAQQARYLNASDSHRGRSQLITVQSKQDALDAIGTICDQGEGAHHSRWDDKSHAELSHYYKFLELQSEHLGFPEKDVLPTGRGFPKIPKPAKNPLTAEEVDYFVYNFKKNLKVAEVQAVDPVAADIVTCANALYQYMLIMTETVLLAEGHEQKMLFYTGMHNSMIWMLDKYVQSMRLIQVKIGRETYALCPTWEFVDMGSRADGYKGALQKLKRYAVIAQNAVNQSANPSNYSDIADYFPLITCPSNARLNTPPLPDVANFWARA